MTVFSKPMHEINYCITVDISSNSKGTRYDEADLGSVAEDFN